MNEVVAVRQKNLLPMYFKCLVYDLVFLDLTLMYS